MHKFKSLKKSLIAMLILTITVQPMLSLSLLGQEEVKTEKAVTTKKVSATWASGSSKMTASGPRGLSLREARKMGFTLNNMLEAVKELRASEDITSETSDAEVAAMVVNHIYGKNSLAWGDPAAVNWDSILAFVEKMLPLILKLIELFSDKTSVLLLGPDAYIQSLSYVTNTSHTLAA